MADATIVVLALDAADHQLLQRWGCEHILLDNHSELETYAHSQPLPFTPEVWTTVATGLHPEEHGVTGDMQEWDSTALRAASHATKFLPTKARRVLGRPFRSDGEDGARLSFGTTDADHVFDNGRVEHWPGITPATNLSEAWHWTDLAEAGDLTENELDARLRANTGEELGYLASVAATDTPIVGVHSHALDVAGHVYARREDRLREVYQWVDGLVGDLRQRVDRLLILSDHGMQVDWLDNEHPGRHSWRAFVSSTEPGDLPASVFDVRYWLARRKPRLEAAGSGAVSMDTTTEHLQDLGYLEG